MEPSDKEYRTMMMKTIATACAVATAAMSFSGAAFARDHDGDRGHGRGASGWEQRGSHGDRGHDRGQYNGNYGRHDRGSNVVVAPAWRGDNHRYEYRNHVAPRYYSYGGAPRYVYNSGYAPRWRVGGYYSGPRYVVNNWGAYPGLYAPPYGYQWVQSDTGDFLLVAIASGIIANLLMNSRF
jgi:Ni/Co efflux regulator RcnB